jgi:hypothetical protein
MKRLALLCLLPLAVTGSFAGPREDAVLAAVRLSEQPNYSWVATIADDARTYDIAGKTSKEGFTRVRMPLINSVRRRLGLGATDADANVIFRGNLACVVETERGWLRLDELPAATEPEPQRGRRRGPPTGAASGSGKGGRGPARSGAERGYSNLQFGISHPHEELGVIVSSHAELGVESDVVSGTLTELGAQLLLVSDGQESITPTRARGTFKLWVRNGHVVKYHLQLEGTLLVQTPAGKREVNVQQTTDTVIKDVGTTKVDVPEEARLKLTW